MNSNRFKLLIDREKDDIMKLKNHVDELRLNTDKIVKISELTNQLKYTFLLKTEILDYSLIDEIWVDFIAQKFKIEHKKKLDIIDFGGIENRNCILLENLFLSHIDSPNEDLIMVYAKGSSEITYYLKSYQIINKNKISLPFYTVRIPSHNIFNSLDESLKEGEIMISCL